MKVNFDKSGSSKDMDGDMFLGDFETMQKHRKKELPKIEKTINEVLGDYDGGMVVIIRVREDENGDPEGHNMFIGGVAKLETQVKMASALKDSGDQLIEKVMEKASGNPHAMLSIAKELLGDMLNDIKKEK